jgi:two-component system cell cycle response regulator
MNVQLENAADIEVVGFNQHERMLIASMFKVSSMRERKYRKWNPVLKSAPDCVLLDDDTADTPTEIERCKSRGQQIVLVGTRHRQESQEIAYVPRPIRWAEILNTLDTVMGTLEAEEIEKAEPTEARSDAENKLELLQIEPWYTGGAARTFKTPPALLIVDPNHDEAQDLKAKFADSGFRVDIVASIAETLAQLTICRYNCLILETKLPYMDGFFLCERIKQSQDRRRIATIFLTTSHKATDRIRGARAGCDAYLCKPADRDKLISVLEKFIPSWSLA